MSNPMLNEKRWEEARAGWAAPTPPSNQWAPPGPGSPGGSDTLRGVDDGPVTPWTQAMTLSGTVTATAVLFVLLLASAVFGWTATEQSPSTDQIEMPAFAIVGVLVGLGCAIVLYFRPQWAKVLGPVYALLMGYAVGAISHAYEIVNNGIVVQAAGATVATFFVMLVLYRTGVIKVNDKYRRIVIGATLGVMVLYGVSLLMSLFGDGPTFLDNASLLGIGLSVLICVIAAANLGLDFDFIERGTKMGLPKHFEWFAAFGLLVTIVWLYLEILRLLSKLRN